MAGLIFELTGALSRAAARELRERAARADFSRSELLAFATLADTAATCLQASANERLPNSGDRIDELIHVAADELGLLITGKTSLASSGQVS
jgi:hypothetical protein